MRFNTLEQWLDWQEGLHPRAIDLGLDRVSAVWQRLANHELTAAVVTVAGTNGKGSCVAMLDSILRTAGYRVGVYTSPHLRRYNERIRICGNEIDDESLCEAFSRVDQARDDVSLSYFEFGTLAALDLFQRSELDVILLEVGLGGRLDAVNIIDPDVALLTSVGIDHTEWLGQGREQIGREKAGIFRAGRPAVCADPSPPASVYDVADATGAKLYLIDREFGYRTAGSAEGLWQWWGQGVPDECLPYPALQGEVQLQNAAAVLMVLSLLQEVLPVSSEQIASGLQQVRLPGRFQVVPCAVPVILDVTHNASGAVVLSQNLAALPCAGKTYVVVSMLQDKDMRQVAAILGEQVDHWYVAGLQVARGCDTAMLATQVRAGLECLPVEDPVTECPDVRKAYCLALEAAEQGDRIVVFGSFYTVAEVMQVMEDFDVCQA